MSLEVMLERWAKVGMQLWEGRNSHFNTKEFEQKSQERRISLDTWSR